MNSIKICHLYPDVLNLYGDRGNIICMEKRLFWRNIDVQVVDASIGSNVDFSDCDIFFMGGGQDFEQSLLLEDIQRGKGDEIRQVVEDGKVFLAICGGYQILGNTYTTWQGEKQDFIGALDLETVGQEDRMIGNYLFSCDDIGSNIVGFENHSGKTYLGPSITPMGKVFSGYGNNGEDGCEGARYKNVFASYCHGPILPKNPKLCDHLLTLALERKYGKSELEPLPDVFETEAHNYMEHRLKK